MKEIIYRNRQAYCLENQNLRVTVMAQGGHVAEILHKPSQMNPLWLPPWPSIEPAQWQNSCESLYGPAYEGKMLSCVLGHFLCLDTFGAPSPEEQAAGAVFHGEALLTKCAVSGDGPMMTCSWELKKGCLRITRKLVLEPSSFVLQISETVENCSMRDYPTAWTQHVTLGPPFLEQGVTEFRIPDVRSMSLDNVESGPEETSTFTSSRVAGGFVTHLIDPAREHGYYAAYSPSSQVLHGYVWKRSDFPWIGVWEEVRSRQHSPWNGETLARGMEFGVSPFPEARRDMIRRGELFGKPSYRWIPAQSKITVDYCAFLCKHDSLPRDVLWDNKRTVAFL